MADSKITALTALTAADPVNDMFPVVDVSDTSMAASGTTKRISANNILSSSPTASGALTVTGLVTAGSATITGALTSNGGLTTSGVGAYVAVQGSGNPATGSGIEMSGGATPFLLTYNRTGSAYLPFTIDCSSFVVKSAGDAKMTLASGNLSLANGNLVMSTSGKGIDFSATADGSGTMTSELLNDYEEGVFDAFFITGGGTVTINPGSNQCRYTKIGRLVTVQGDISVSSVSSPTGALLISGLPYTIATGAEGNAYSAASLFPSGLQATATGQIVGYGVAGTSSIYMYRYELGTIIGLAPSAQAASDFIFSMTYSV